MVIGHVARALDRRCGAGEQENILFSKTIRENVTYNLPADAPLDEVWAAVQQANAKEFVEAFTSNQLSGHARDADRREGV